MPVVLGACLGIFSTMNVAVPVSLFAQDAAGAARQHQPTTALAQDPTTNPTAHPAGGALAQLDREITALAERARQSVVKITVMARIALPFPDSVPDDMEKSISMPVTYSGIVVRADGFILTVADALPQGTHFHVQLPDNRRVEAKVWAIDPRTNLGVLKIDTAETGPLTAVEFADSDAVRAGQFLLTCGNPFGLTRSVSTGLVTGTDRTVVVDGVPHFGVIQTNATINPGDPGGACFDASGRVIGLIWSTFGRSGIGGPDRRGLRDLLGPRDGSDRPDMGAMIEVWKEQINRMFQQMASSSDGMFLSAQGINFILPANTVAHISRELIAHKRVRRAQLGVELTTFSPEPTALPMVQVQGVVADGAADRAGIRRGDLLVKMNGHDVHQLADVQRIMRNAVPEQSVSIVIIRNGTALTVTATLHAAPDDPR